VRLLKPNKNTVQSFIKRTYVYRCIDKEKQKQKAKRKKERRKWRGEYEEKTWDRCLI
jgi:hypothetical protein